MNLQTKYTMLEFMFYFVHNIRDIHWCWRPRGCTRFLCDPVISKSPFSGFRPLHNPAFCVDFIFETNTAQFKIKLLCDECLSHIPYDFMHTWHGYHRDDSRLAFSQWETALQSNAVSHWLGANLESALISPCTTRNTLFPTHSGTRVPQPHRPVDKGLPSGDTRTL